MSLKANYSIDELEAVAEGYEELREHPNKAWIHVRLIDMWRAFYALSRERRQAVLLVGMCGYSTRQASPLLHVSHTTVSKRYLAGLDAMRNYLNGVRYQQSKHRLAGGSKARSSREQVKSWNSEPSRRQ